MHIVGKTFQKIVPPQLLSIEFTKTKQAICIGDETGLFYVPRLLSSDVEEGLIEFEYLNNLRCIWELVVCNDSRLPIIFENLGLALAIVHDRLILSNEMKTNLPNEWMNPIDDNVFIHGDLTIDNVCFQEISERLVIVDWSTAPLLGGISNFGSRYFDIIWFMSHMFYGMPAKGFMQRRIEELIDMFIHGYTLSFNSNFNYDLFRYFHRQMKNLYRKIIWQRAMRYPWYKRGLYYGFQMWMYQKWRAYKPKIIITRKHYSNI